MFMRNLFLPPNITQDFDNFKHSGGLMLRPQDDLLTLQEDLLAQDFKLNGERRQNFINLDAEPQSETQTAMQAVLKNAAAVVSAKVAAMTGRDPRIDKALSAIWIESESAHSNLAVHRDSNAPDLIRATFSISPTRLLPADVVLPIDELEWDQSRYPMGTTVLPGMENQTVAGELGGIGLMTGTTYHKAPTPDEIYLDFKKKFGSDLQAKAKNVPRVFGSIWGKI